MERMPTPEELMKRIEKDDYNFISCRHGDSTIIRKYKDKPVIAYGIGFAGFVCVIRHSIGLIGYAYGCKFPLSFYKHSGASVADVDKVLETIKNNKMIAEKAIDEEGFKNLPNHYIRPVVASFTQCRKSDDAKQYDFRLVRLKNGKLRPEHKWKSWNTFSRYNLPAWLDTYKGNYNGYYNKDVNVPKKILEEVEGQVLTEAI